MALVPPTVVTVILTVPAVPAGEVAVIEVGEITVTPVAAVTPKLTVVAPTMKPVPPSARSTLLSVVQYR
jgi:hypothetical protein